MLSHVRLEFKNLKKYEYLPVCHFIIITECHIVKREMSANYTPI